MYYLNVFCHFINYEEICVNVLKFEYSCKNMRKLSIQYFKNILEIKHIINIFSLLIHLNLFYSDFTKNCEFYLQRK